MKERLKGEIKNIKNAIEVLEKELKEKRLQLDQIEFGVKIGDIIEYEGKEYKISCFGMFWLKGFARKKNGEFRLNENNLYNFKRK